jgi:hypothetical protein
MKMRAVLLTVLVSILSISVKADQPSQAILEAQLQEMMSFEIENISRTETTVRSCEIRTVRTLLRRCAVFGQAGTIITTIDLRSVEEIVERTIYGDLLLSFRPAELPLDQSLVTDFVSSTQAWYCDGSFASDSASPLGSLDLPLTGRSGLFSMLSEYYQTYCN